MDKKIHAISHTHWDREWYFTDSESRVLLSKALDEIIEALENNPDFLYYHLDGQSSLIESYLEQKPNERERIEKLVSEGRLLVGPWYTQPDIFNINAESIVRNFKYGIEYAEDLGKSMDIAYLPDTFGSNAQLPQIANGCGLTGIIVRRGYSPEVHGDTELVWKSLDGTEVLTAVQAYGYSVGHPVRGARNRNFDKEHLKIETYPLMESVKKLSASQHVMCPIGGDQVSVDKDFNLFVDKLNEHKTTDDEYIQSSLPIYMDEIRKEIDNFKVFEGEFRTPVYSRVHKTIGSSRYDIKDANHVAEQHLIRVSEPITAIAKDLNFWYDQTSLERAWKLILQAHAHDSMGGCNSDETNKEIVERCIKADQIAIAIYNILAKNIVLNIENNEYNSYFTIFNGGLTNNAKRSKHILVTDSSNFKLFDDKNNEVKFDIVKQIKIKKPRKVLLTVNGEVEENVDEYYYVSNIYLGDTFIPTLGYTTLFIKEENNDNSEDENSKTNKVENDFYIIEVENGKLSLFDKETKNKYIDFVYFEDVADDGDLYDFSPIDGDTPIIIKNVEVANSQIKSMHSELELKYEFELPKSLLENRQGRTSEVVSQCIKLSCKLWKDSKRIEFTATYNNEVDDHRLRAIFDLGKSINEVYADLPFGYIKRESNTDTDLKISAEYNVNIEPLQNSLIVPFDPNNYMSLLVKSIKEYQVIDNNKIGISLFKGVGQLGKNDLVYRPGRASGREYSAPDGQLRKELTFDFAFEIYNNEENVPFYKTLSSLDEYLNPFFSYQNQDLKKDVQRLGFFDISVKENKVNTSYGYLNSEYLMESKLIFSSITETKNGDKLLRLFNPSDNEIAIDISKVPLYGKAYKSDFLGNNMESVDKCVVNRFQAINILIK